MIQFHHPHIPKDLSELEDVLGYTSQNINRNQIATELLSQIVGKPILLTDSCTTALELAAILINVIEGDEVIVPAYGFTSTANAFLLRGAKVVFCDIDPMTLTLDQTLALELVTEKTRAVVPIHYSGVATDFSILKSRLPDHRHLIEDAAQAVGSFRQQKHAGTEGTFGTLSFHSSKIVHCFSGGSLIVNDPGFMDQAKELVDKGTNRTTTGTPANYTWNCVGTAAALDELRAAYLVSALDDLNSVIKKRELVWTNYFDGLRSIDKSHIQLPIKPNPLESNFHFFYFLTKNNAANSLIHYLKKQGIEASSHYRALNKTPFGQRIFHSKNSTCKHSEFVEKNIVRLPTHPYVTQESVNKIVYSIKDFFYQG